MENQDKLHKQFKDAAAKAEEKGFARMDAVWNRVEGKLDNRHHRNMAQMWKYTGIAASLLLFMTIGFFIISENDAAAPNAAPANTVTTIDTSKVENVLKGATEQSSVVTNETPRQELDSLILPGISKKTRTYRSKLGKSEVESYNTGTAEVAVSPVTGEVAVSPAEYSDFAGDSEKTKVAARTEKIVTGVVSDEAGPLPGATVMVKGTHRGTAADMEGNYSIAVKEGETLQFSYAGYNPVEISAATYNNINPTLGAVTLGDVKLDVYRKIAPDKSSVAVTTLPIENIQDRANATIMADPQGQGNGVVISTGSGQPGATTTYDILANGYIQNRPLPGNISTSQYTATAEAKNRNYRDRDRESIAFAEKKDNGTEKMYDSPSADVLQSLQGQVAGLTIASGAGEPGNDQPMLRGSVPANLSHIKPLYVIDGVPVDESGFGSLNPNEIVDVKVIRDEAATSIYGNRGANGVIVVTTRETAAPAELDILQRDKNVREAMAIYEYNEEAPVILIDGREAKRREFRALEEDAIESVILLEDDPAKAFYGEGGKNGVIIIRTKNMKSERKESFRQLEQKLNKIGKENYIEVKYGEIPKIPVSNEEEYDSFIENPFENPAISPLSTFSIDVDNASYTNVRRFLNNGQSVPKDAVRVEEMINFFKYQYPQPTGSDPFSINTEYSDAPWNPKHKLLKIGLQGKIIADENLPASNFVFLIDVSGSMNEPNKLPLLKQSLKLLASKMRDDDRIAIVVYAGSAGLVLPSTPGSQKLDIYAAVDNLSAGGSTAGGAGIELAYKIAAENFVKGGNNRVILATDGDFNVGASSDSDMQTLIEEKRKSGVFLTCLGYGMGNYKDSKLETLADKGNGNYAYIDNMQEADRYLNKEFKGSMYTIAKDVKIQIEFNPKHVQSYRLIGYENRKLRDEDFANDAIDAGELGSGHTVTALYEIIPVGTESSYFTPAPELKYSEPAKMDTNYNDELATIKFRHKKPDADISTEMVRTIPSIAIPLQQASADFKFAASVAWFGLKMRDSQLIPNKKTDDIKSLAREGLLHDPEGYRSEFVRLVNMVE